MSRVPVEFFPAVGEPSEPAREVRERCLVRDECLAFALEHDERHGVWGCLSTRERNQLRRLRRAS